MENKIERKLRLINTYINNIAPLTLRDIIIKCGHTKYGFTNVCVFKGKKHLFSTTIYWEFVDSDLYWLSVLSKLAETTYLELKGEYLDE